jgi:hypothetical protein
VLEDVLRASLPDTLLGLNVNFLTFQEHHAPDGRVDPAVVRWLADVPGLVYRYPGGLVANTFDWEAAKGPFARRPKRRTLGRVAAAPVAFGPDEYLEFLRAVRGQSWYVLNLMGWSEDAVPNELPLDLVADSAGRLAAWRRSVDKTTEVRYYQLGNELDRADYEWPVDKYVQRCAAVIKSVLAADPSARLVPFVRDFDWRYRRRPGSSTSLEFLREVLKSLPQCTDYSMNVYYDAPRQGRRTDIAFRTQSVRRIVDAANELPAPAARGLWITEHARQLPQDRRAGGIDDTSGIDGAVSSADFLTTVAAWPEMRGAFWHALGGGKWSLFSDGPGAPKPTAVYWALRLLNQHREGRVLASTLAGENTSGYAGGYDLRAMALSPADGSVTILWLTNRAAEPCALRIVRKAHALRQANMSLARVTGTGSAEDPTAVDVHLAPSPVSLAIDSSGACVVDVPARSVCVLRLSITG